MPLSILKKNSSCIIPFFQDLEKNSSCIIPCICITSLRMHEHGSVHGTDHIVPAGARPGFHHPVGGASGCSIHTATHITYSRCLGCCQHSLQNTPTTVPLRSIDGEQIGLELGHIFGGQLCASHHSNLSTSH